MIALFLDETLFKNCDSQIDYEPLDLAMTRDKMEATARDHADLENIFHLYTKLYILYHHDLCSKRQRQNVAKRKEKTRNDHFIFGRNSC